MQLSQFSAAVDFLKQLTSDLASNLETAADRDWSSFLKAGITAEEFAEIQQSQEQITSQLSQQLQERVNSFFSYPENQNIWTINQAKLAGLSPSSEIYSPIDFVTINTSENLRNPDTGELIRVATAGEVFQVVGDCSSHSNKYQYKRVMDAKGNVFKLCINDGDNVEEGTIGVAEKKEQPSSPEWVVVEQPENLRDPETHAVIRRSNTGERFAVIGELPPRGKFQYKLVRSSSGEEFKICTNDGDRVRITDQAPFQKGISSLIEDDFCNSNGQFTDKVNPMEIHDVINPKEVKNFWIKVPIGLATRRGLPKGVYLEANAVGNTFIYKDFPELGQVRIKSGLMLSLESPPDSETYAPETDEPIPLDSSQLPSDLSELSEIAKRCPIKILYSESEGEAGHPWGHTALEINGKVYSYGRWGKTSGPMGIKGEGALFVFDSFESYNASEGGNVKRVSILGVNASQRQSIEHYFLSKIKQGSTIDGHRESQIAEGEPPTPKVSYSGASEYIIDQYNVFDQNCTTIILNALEAGGGELKNRISRINLESNRWEDFHDAKAVLVSAQKTLADLNISASKRLLEGFQSIIKSGEIDSSLFPVTNDGTIVDTKTQFDGTNIVDLFYQHLSEQYGTENVRLPRNLYQALSSPESLIASVNLSDTDIQVASIQPIEKPA